jgi:predicted transcriptional regulator
VHNLSLTQREILIALIDLYNRNKKLIKSKEIADIISKDEGTVRNIVLSLKVLGLIESKPGPNGGYMPTLKAYEVVKNPSVTPMYDKLTVYKGSTETGIKVNNIELLEITNPSSNKVLLGVTGELNKLRVGEVIRVGPTPYTRLVIEGLIIHVDEERSQVLADLIRMISIPKEKVKNLLNKGLITLKPNMSVKETASVFYTEKIRGAPVVDDRGKIMGIVTTADMIRAVMEERIEEPISSFMRTEVITIKAEDDVLDAVRKMITYGVGRLLVVDEQGELMGIVTRTDILRKIAGLEGTWGV